MKNIGSLMAAYFFAWAIFFGYYVSVARRLNRLQGELNRLKDLLKTR